MTDHWTHLFALELPTREWDLPPTRTACSTPEEDEYENEGHTEAHQCKNHTLAMNTYYEIQNRSLNRLHDIKEEIYETLTSKDRASRFNTKSKRGLFDLGGDLLSFAFGVATHKEIKELQNKVKQMISGLGEIAKVYHNDVDKIVSATGIVNKRVEVANKRIEEQTNMIQGLSRALIAQQKLEVETVTVIAELLQNAAHAENNMEGILTAIRHLVSGKIHPDLIHVKELTSIIHKVGLNVGGFQRSAKVLVRNPGYFYRYEDFSYTRHDENLLVTLHIPIATIPETFYIYKVRTVPKSISSEHTQATIISDAPAYFTISASGNYFASWNEEPKMIPGDARDMINIADISLFYDEANCPMALFKGDIEDVLRLCAMKILTKNPSFAVYIAPSTILLENIDNFTKICGDFWKTTTTNESCSSCLEIPPVACSLRTRNQYYPEHVQIHESLGNRTSRHHLLNLALVKAFFAEDDVRHLQTDTTFMHEFIIEGLPQFKFHQNVSEHQDEELALYF